MLNVGVIQHQYSTYFESIIMLIGAGFKKNNNLRSYRSIFAVVLF